MTYDIIQEISIPAMIASSGYMTKHWRLDMDSLSQKRCNVCGEIKPVSEFYKKGKHYRFQCKACNKLYAQVYFKSHVEEFRKRSERWEKENPERRKEICRDSYIRNKDKIRARSKKWFKDHPDYQARSWAKRNPERSKALIKKWDSTHKEEKLEHAWRRRARLFNVGGEIKKEEWSELKEKYGNRCLCCGKSNVPLTLDHIIPVSKGGPNTIDNIQPLCKSCNSKKSTKTIDYRGGR